MNQKSGQQTGQCLCGAITITATLQPGIGACHCGMCRRWAGSPWMTVNADGAVTFTGEEHIGIFSSSEWAERGFCKACGTNLFYHLKPGGFSEEGEFILSAGLFEDQSDFNFDHEVYVDHAPGWYELAGGESRQRMTEADIMKMVNAPTET